MVVIVKRNLKDYDSWKQMVVDMNSVRKGYGSKGSTVYRNAEDPNEVYLVMEWDDHKSYHEYFNRPDVQKALAETGETMFIEVGESFRLES